MSAHHISGKIRHRLQPVLQSDTFTPKKNKNFSSHRQPLARQIPQMTAPKFLLTQIYFN